MGTVSSADHRALIEEGLRCCGVDALLLQIHDQSFPSEPEEELGRGSPYGCRAERFLRFARSFGFTGVQLGPQGKTSADNPSPYDGTVFSRTTLGTPLARLVAEGLVDELWAREQAAPSDHDPSRVDYDRAFQVQEAALARAHERLRAGGDRVRPVRERLRRFVAEQHDWLERDALYAALFEARGGQSWRTWASPSGEPHPDRFLYWPAKGDEERSRARREQVLQFHAEAVERAELAQLLAHEAHADFRERLSAIGLRCYADLQIGLSDQDAWAYRSVLLEDYLMGAPPSRTNPAGQPWGFAVLDPDQYLAADGAPGPALRHAMSRLAKVASEYDGVRIDHPHGWVCPWVYRTGQSDPYEAVRGGARLFSSPDLEDHPELAHFAIAAPDQLDRGLARYAEGWVRDLTDEQVAQYSLVFERIVRPTGGEAPELEVVCEVLSTLPYPLRRVLERYGLGRFRVLQKVDPKNPTDVYRAELAAPADWIMLGNHDTPPIWRLARAWAEDGRARARAEDLAPRLCPTAEDRDAWVERHATEPGLLAHAMVADLLLSPARHVMVFVSDLLGETAIYNDPGTVKPENWTLRVPRDFEEVYRERVARDAALNLALALAMAVAAPAYRGPTEGRDHLLRRLLERARALRAG